MIMSKMFGFMKKHSERDREEKDRRKKEKKEQKEKRKRDKSLTQEEMTQLEEAHRRLAETKARNGKANSVTPSGSSDSLVGDGEVYTSQLKLELSKIVKVPPPTKPKPPKKGILKGRSNYGPEIPNQGVRGNLDDTQTLEENTLANELLIEKQNKLLAEAKLAALRDGNRTTPSGPAPAKPLRGRASLAKPPPPPSNEPPDEVGEINVEVDSIEVSGPPSPAEKTYTVNLQLPNVAPPRSLTPRDIVLRRLPAGDFGFTLRRGTVLERGLDDNSERKRTVIFAEPGPRNMHTGLLPGDRLIEVNGNNVEMATREEIIDFIRKSGNEVLVKVQPIPELSELSVRSGIEGGEVAMSEQNVKMGTLKRSGSMRYKSRVAKSEDQVQEEQAWLSAERVWLVHKGGFAAGRLLKPEGEESAAGKCKVKLDHGGEVLDVDEEDVEKMNLPQFDRVEDLTSLVYMNESSILHTLRQRYGSNLIHSYAGRTLLVLNPMHPLSIYSEKVIQMFRGCKPEDMPPHIYATAQIAYRNMLNLRRDQAIVLMGRSGSGKTTNSRHVLHYYTVAAGGTSKVVTTEKLNSVLTLLDAFGNSRTIMNTSATRFTQMTSLDFDHMGQIVSMSIQVLMLEKSRIARRPEGEPTFHVFYHMLAGIDSQLRKELQLDNLNEPNLFMTPLQRQEDRQKATQVWAKIHHSMTNLGISESESHAIYSVLAAIYHLGVAGHTKGANNKSQFARPAAAQRAAQVLGMGPDELFRAIFNPLPQASPKAGYRGTPEHAAPHDKEDIGGLEALEGFVIGLYSEVFHALVSLINRTLTSTCRTVASILVIDCPGFHNPASCGRNTGATFEDLCHNYVQERLQLLFHETVFTHQQDLYSQENIKCDFETVTSSPAAMVTLIDKPSQQTLVRSPSRDHKSNEKCGLLWLLDEEAIMPGATDESFTGRVFHLHGHGADRPASVSEEANTDKGSNSDGLLKKAAVTGDGFTLNHFQGTNPVYYKTSGWLHSSRENPVSRGASTILQESQKEDISNLFSTVCGSVSSLVSGSVVGLEGSASLRRTSSMRRTYTTGTAAIKRKSICLQVKFQTDSVIETLRRARLHFIHCLLPQHNAGLCDLKSATKPEDIMLNVPVARAQVRGSELVDAIRIHRQGFPDHMPFAEFRQRFEILIAPDAKTDGHIVDEKMAVQKLLEALEMDTSVYRLGLSQVFLRAGSLAQLEDLRDEKVTGTIVAVQALCRGYLGRKALQKRKLQDLAVRCIQRNVQKFMAIRNWSWWRLYNKVQPLLNVHRTEEELKNKDDELETLKAKLDKLEKEKHDYKSAADKYEAKLSEITMDLQEEHTTTSHAAEMLEGETAERLRLERELREIQREHTAVLRKNELAEIELMHARMLNASMDAELDSDEDDDSVYRERYERLRRQMEFSKKQLEQQHEEEQQQQLVARTKIERKLIEAITAEEEQQGQVKVQKRKVQRLNQDMADIKHHLEDQVGRNAELEKKQRKFDSELQKISDQLRQERLTKDKLQRERDALATEKFTIEQSNKSTLMDFELQSEKLQRLEREVQDISSMEKDDKEQLALRRQKADLERRLADQEEELDEQAGTIQQLEQAKLRLEMATEKIRQQHLKELEERDEEVESVRASAQKKVKSLQTQLEEDYAERQNIMREKRDLEHRIKTMSEEVPTRDRETEKRLRRDLKRTKALLQDAQTMLHKQREAAGSRSTIKQIRNQLEDAEFATAAAVKARKGVEIEVQDLQQQLEDIQRSKHELEERCLLLGREKNDLQSRIDEYDEDVAEIMKKYKAVVQQQSVDLLTIQDQSKTIEELQRENQALKEQVASLQSQVDFLGESTVDKQMTVRLEAKIREIESKLVFEQTTKQRIEAQLSRLKEQTETVNEERERLTAEAQKHQEVAKRGQRQLRDLREEYGELERKEVEASQRKHDLEKKVDLLETEHDQCQADLRLAFKRIDDLQTAIDDNIVSDDDSDALSDYDDTEEDDSDEEEDDRALVMRRRSAGGDGPHNHIGELLDESESCA